MVTNLEIVLKYFDYLTDRQQYDFLKMYDLYLDWNEKINVISRSDLSNFFIRHILHSLSVLKFYGFNPGNRILDLGTGGGFPGIPLAILLPECELYLIDGTAKKIKVVSDVIDKLELKNAKAFHIRAEEYREKFDYIVTRAVADISKLKSWSHPLLKNKSFGPMPPGIFAYKGGNMTEELKILRKDDYIEINEISSKIKDEYFLEKKIIYLQK